ncbi:MAG: hypothetical protein WCD35_00515 [Mycobacteriales bacterium]
MTTVLLCRGCCCGTAAKHPTTDHDAQEQELLAAAPAGVRVRVVDCLDECDRSNVVVLRRGKKDDTWLGGVLSERASAALVSYVADGARGELPDAIRGLRFRHSPPRRR